MRERMAAGAVAATLVAFAVSGMTFWETVWAAIVAFLVGSALVGGPQWLWRRLHRPDITIRPFGQNGGSTHSTSEARWLRWFHAEVVGTTAAGALHPEVMVWPPDARIYEQWSWAGHKTHQAVPKETPLLIPLVLGNFTTSVGGTLSNSTGVAPGEWFLTPDDMGPRGRHQSLQPNAVYIYKVRVRWLRDGTHHDHRDAEFRVRMGALGQPPVFEQVKHGWHARYLTRVVR